MSEPCYDPDEIRRRSREIVRQRLPDTGRTESHRAIEESVAYATGDCELVRDLDFINQPIRSARQSVTGIDAIVTDVGMVRQGIRQSYLDSYDLESRCYVHDDRTYKLAEQRDITRSAAGIDRALDGEETFWLIVGNAPTALFRLFERVRDNPDLCSRIPLVVGVPVGFVGVTESKRQLLTSDFPAIVLRGHRGGSPVGATIVNSLLRRTVDGN